MPNNTSECIPCGTDHTKEVVITQEHKFNFKGSFDPCNDLPPIPSKYDAYIVNRNKGEFEVGDWIVRDADNSRWTHIPVKIYTTVVNGVLCVVNERIKKYEDKMTARFNRLKQNMSKKFTALKESIKKDIASINTKVDKNTELICRLDTRISSISVTEINPVVRFEVINGELNYVKLDGTKHPLPHINDVTDQKITYGE